MAKRKWRLYAIRPIEERFWEKVTKQDNGCWIWQSNRTQAGYGLISRGRRGEGVEYAHRLSYLWHGGSIPEGYELDHLCRNRACVRPEHLEAVPHQVNSLRGEAPTVRLHRLGHCKRGHDRIHAYIVQGRVKACRLCKQEMRKAGLWS